MWPQALGRIVEAREAAEEAVRLDPDSSQVSSLFPFFSGIQAPKGNIPNRL